MEFNINEYYGLVSQGKVREIMAYLSQFPDCEETLEDYIRIYEKEDYPLIGLEEGIYEILLCYQKYYREVFYLEQPEPECRERLRQRLVVLFPEVPPDMDINMIEEGPLLSLIREEGWYLNPGSIGGYRSPFIWKKSEPKTYQVELPEGTQEYTFHFAEDFIFLGWWWYLSMGRYGTGAWVDDDGTIYCDWRSYDLDSEDFRISMLKHEAQHLADLKRWPDLSNEGLEYRAYLLDLIYYEKENRLLHFHANASLDDPGNEYAVAAYHICSAFYHHFHVEDFAEIPIPDIQSYARQLFRESTEDCIKAFGE